MHILEQIFGSDSKVKIMRMFLGNASSVYTLDDVRHRADVSLSQARRELKLLFSVGLIRKKKILKEVEVGKNKRRVNGFTLDATFPYLEPLYNFLIHINPIQYQEMVRKISRVGKIKLLLVSGVFIQNTESRVDLLVVGDHIKKGALDSVIRSIESEIGKELRYSAFETTDFHYRVGMFDKLIRDILDYPHEKVIDKLGVS